MAKQRKTLRAEDLTSAALVQSTETGRIYRLGPPKKKNVNLNVVNHCQLYARNGRLAGTAWWNLSNLRDSGFKLYRPLVGQLSLRPVTERAAA
ncbi:hypothetical protein [Hymenobacter ruber]